MPNEIKFADKMSTATSVLSTELNSLADGARSDAGMEYGNSVVLNTFAQLELVVTFTSAPDSGGYVILHMITAANDSNFSDGSSSVEPCPNEGTFIIPLRASTSQQRRKTIPFRLTPAKTKFLLTNESGQALPSSGTQVYLYTWNEEIQD